MTGVQTCALPISYTLGDGNSITVDVSKQTQSYYDYEVDLNDSKKTIKILQDQFVLPAEQEFKTIINNIKWVIFLYNNQPIFMLNG